RKPLYEIVFAVVPLDAAAAVGPHQEVMHRLIEARALRRSRELIFDRSQLFDDVDAEPRLLAHFARRRLFECLVVLRGSLRQCPESIHDTAAEQHLEAVVAESIHDATGGY